MVKLTDEHDLETLRQISLLLDCENQRLVAKTLALTAEVARLRGVPDAEQLTFTVEHEPQKTALFGMTRTGKSNTTKIVLKTIIELRWRPTALRIGQVIFDLNGEYVNENAQDAGTAGATWREWPRSTESDWLPTRDN
jgi:hypothetical protein